MKILIFGSSGQLGKSLYDVLKNSRHDTYFLSKEDADISNKEQLYNVMLEISPQFVVNTAAYTMVDNAESDPDNAYIVNFHSVKNLADICKLKKIHLIHISTDYVFDGTKIAMYIENDIPNPQSIYGISKLKGEIAIQESMCSHTIIRTSWVFSQYGKNFLKTMLNLATKKELNIVGDQYGCPTYTRDLALIIKKIIEKNNQKLFNGIFHYAGDNITSWSNFAEYIFRKALDIGLINKKPYINKVKTKDYPSQAPRPNNSALNSSLICNLLQAQPSDWKRSVIIALNEIKKLSKNS